MAWPLTGRESEQQQIRGALDDPQVRSLALFGPPGAGSSRLLEVVDDHAAARGWYVLRCAASPARRTVPFGAVAPVGTDDGAELVGLDRLAVINAIEHSILQEAAGRELVVAVDEVQWLDASSVALLERLRDHRGARIVVTGRDRPGDESVMWFLSSVTVAVEIGPLSRSAHDRLLAAACGRPPSRDGSQAVWEHTEGRPRDLEILLDAIERSDAAERDADLWHWSGEPVDSPALRALVAEHLDGLGAKARLALERVAVGSPVPPEVAAVVLDDDDREALERAGSIRSGEAGLCLSRPLVGMALVAQLGPTARRRHLAALAEVMPQPGAAWALRHARWASEAGLPLGCGDPLPLARDALATSQLALAEHLARAALERDGTVEARLLLAECLRRRRCSREAIAELERAMGDARTDDEIADVAILRSQVETLLNRSPERALAVIDEAMGRVATDSAARRLARERSLASAFIGPLGTNVEYDSAGATPKAPAAMDEHFAVVLLACLHLDLAGIDDALARLREVVSEGRPDAMTLARLAVCEHLAAVGSGRVGEGHHRARVALDSATERGDPVGLPGLCVAFSGPLVGDVDGAATAALDADRSLRSIDPFGLRPFAAGVGAVAALQAGRPGAAAALSRIAEAGGRTADPRVAEIAAGRRRAWEAVLAGDPARGAREAAASGRLAMAGGHRLWGVIGLHEAVRLGSATLVLDDLAGADIDTPLSRAFGAHAQALVDEDAARLDTAALDLARLGCWLLAAEASAHAARFGEAPADAARSAARAEIWWNRCSGRVPPALVDAPRGLTVRQHEIAGLAARGLSSQEIADRLVVSCRTVDNHLRSVYRRLDVAGREELAAVLGPALG